MGKGAQQVAEQPPPEPASAASAKASIGRWVVDGEEYDLTEFIPKHPGGMDMFVWANGRDITIPVYTYHKDPVRTVLPLLKKYKVQAPAQPIEDVVKHKLGIPHFLLPPGFDAATDIPTYDFNPADEGLLLTSARKRVLAPDVQRTIRRLDDLFDGIVVAVVVAYFGLLAAWLHGVVPWYAAVPAFAVLRTSMAAGGHYYVHRARPCKGDWLFDLNYVGMAFTAQDGHVLIHHAYTQSDADVKRGFFGGMMGIPRLLRVPVHTLHKLGHVLTGMLVRGYECEFEPDNDEHQGAQEHLRRLNGHKLSAAANWQFWAAHLWLRVELVAAVYCGVGWAWLGQFAAALWMNTLMVVSSHDFEDVLESDCKDWARYQLLNAHDMKITGNPWVDCFLSAGLSPHRAHHIFPYQKSAFANYYSNRILSAAVKEHGLPWCAPKSWFTEIFPEVWRMYLAAPLSDPLTRKRVYPTFVAEHIAPEAYKYCFNYVCAGFLGIGSI